MTMKTEPFLSGKWGWDLGENNWKDGADENFLKFSYLLNKNVDGFVSSLPSSPANGTAYFLTTDNTLNARIDGSWYKFSVPKGFEVVEKATGNRYEFNGSAFVASLGISDKVKLDGISTGATANATNAELRDRSTHTGTQAISTIAGLQTSLNTKATSDNPTFTGNVIAPTAPVGDNSTKVATTAFIKSQNYLTAASAGVVSSVAGRTGDIILTKADVGLSDVNNTADTLKPISNATQTALDAKAPLASPTFTGTVVLPSATSIGAITAAQISYLSGVTSNIQGQINSLSGSSGAFAPINNPTFTGTVNGITKGMVGLGNVDNTSDISKPISTATQSALNNKQGILSGTGLVRTSGSTISYDNTNYAPLGSPTFSGTVSLPSTTSIGSITPTQINYLVNISSDVQTQLNLKANSTNPIFAGKIFGDFSNSIFSSRTLFQTSSVNGSTSLGLIPNGSSVVSSFVAFSNSDPSNTSYSQLASGTGGTDLIAGRSGSGNYLPITFYTGGVARLSISTSGVLTASDASGLAGLNASNISTGTLSLARLPVSFSSGNTPNYAVQRDASGDIAVRNIFANAFYGDGANLTNLNYSQLSWVPVQQGGGIGQSTNKLYLGWSGAGKLKLTVDSTDLGAIAFENFSSNASNLSSGILPDARLSSNVVTKATPSQLFQSLGSVSGTVTVNAANGTHVLLTVAGATTLVLTSPASNEVVAYTVEVTNGGTSYNHPSGTRWAGGVAPTLTASGTDIIVYTKAGTNAWRGYLSAKDSK